ncbi:MAG: class I SAM-dependent methyltransferase [Nanoarchaeota archaeon]|nr:class I SAM-dependent methyltransferase [Nanoarchaeota archaeon]
MTINIPKAWERRFKEKINCQSMNLPLKMWLSSFLRVLDKNTIILDSGCGTGEKAYYIYKRGLKVIGIDSSASAIAFAKKNIHGPEFFKKDCIRTGFKPNSFGAIVSIAVLHCFMKRERLKYIRELRRLLSPGGYLFVLVLSSDDTTKSREKEIEKGTFIQSNGIPFHLFTNEEIVSLFNNFKIIELKHHKKKTDKGVMACYTLIMS